LVLVYPWAMVWMAREALKELDLSAKELFRHLRPIAVPTGLMAFSVVMVQWLPTLELTQHLLRLVVASTIGAIVYVSAVSLMRRPLANEIWEVLGWILRRKQTVGLSDLASSHGAPAP
jgi:hypothetical protein